MLLLIHISTALASIIIASVMYIKPSLIKLLITYGLSASTLATGSYLVMHNTAHLAEACIMGLGFFMIILYTIVSTRRKLAYEKAS